jgi:hypothetical protein
MAAVAVLLAVEGTARGDWLVLRDGSRVETRGPWQEKGKLLVFTRPDGSLASMRANLVDLEASRKTTASAAAVKVAQPKPAAPAPAKKLAVLTDKDFQHHVQPPTVAAAKDSRPGSGSPVEVTYWRKAALPAGDGTQILGTLQNASPGTATNLGLEISLFDEKGALVATAPATINVATLEPKGSTDFKATFVGVIRFADVRFDAKAWVPEAAATPASEGTPPPPPASGPPAEQPAGPPPP